MASHDLHVDAQGRIIGLGKAGGEYLNVIVLDGQGELAEIMPIGEIGMNNQGHLILWQGDYFVASYDYGDIPGYVLLRMNAAGETMLHHNLAVGVWLPVVAIDGDGVVLYGDQPTRLLDLEGHILANLGEIEELDGTWLTTHHHVAARDSGFFVAARIDGHTQVRALDGAGEEQWVGIRRRNGDVYGGAEAIAATGSGGGVAVGYETVEWNDDDEFVGSEQPLIVGFDAAGELLWADRIAVMEIAREVAIGADGAVYVAGHAEFLTEDDVYDISISGWIRRYDPPAP